MSNSFFPFQPSRAPEIIDITVMDNEMDEDKLGEQFSTITIADNCSPNVMIDDDREKSHRGFYFKDQVVLGNSDNDIRFNRANGMSSEPEGSMKNDLMAEVILNKNQKKGSSHEFKRLSEQSKRESSETGGKCEAISPTDVTDSQLLTTEHDVYKENNFDKIEVVAVDDDIQENVKNFRESGGNAEDNSEILTLPCEEDDDNFGFSRVKDRLKRNKVNEAFSEDSDVSDDDEKALVRHRNRGEKQKNVLLEEVGRKQDNPGQDSSDFEDEEEKDDETEDEEGKDDVPWVNLATPQFPDVRMNPRVDQDVDSEGSHRSSDLHGASDESSSESDDKESEMCNQNRRSGKGIEVPLTYEIRDDASHFDNDEVSDLPNVSFKEDKQPKEETSAEVITINDSDLGDNDHVGVIEESEEEEDQEIVNSEEDRIVEDSEEEESMIEDSEEEEHRKIEDSEEEENGKIEDSEEGGKIKNIKDEDIEDSEEKDCKTEGSKVTEKVTGNREQGGKVGNTTQEYGTIEDGEVNNDGSSGEQEQDNEEAGDSVGDDVMFKDDHGAGEITDDEEARASNEEPKSDNSRDEDDSESSEEEKMKKSEGTKSSESAGESSDDSDGCESITAVRKAPRKGLEIASDEESSGEEREKENIPLNTSLKKLHKQNDKSEKGELCLFYSTASPARRAWS